MALEFIDAITLLFPNYAIAAVVAVIGLLAYQELRDNSKGQRKLNHNVRLMLRILIKKKILDDDDIKDIDWGD